MSAKNLDVRSLQLWADGGKTVYVSGDPRGELRMHAEYADKEGREATAEERRAVLVETIAGELVERDILANDSALVGDLMKLQYDGRGDLAEAFADENVSNLRPDPSEWTLEECREWLEDNGHDLPHPNPWAMERAELAELLDYEDDGKGTAEGGCDTEMLRSRVQLGMSDEEIDGLDEWREAVRENADDCDVYQWFRVSTYLASHLKDIGQPVLENEYGEWWGRTCCGQSIIMDGTLQRVADRIVR